MFKIVGDEVWLDGWLVARLNVNLPATLLQLVEEYLAEKTHRDQIVELDSQVYRLEKAAEELEKKIAVQETTIKELKSELEDVAWEYGGFDSRAKKST